MNNGIVDLDVNKANQIIPNLGNILYDLGFNKVVIPEIFKQYNGYYPSIASIFFNKYGGSYEVGTKYGKMSVYNGTIRKLRDFYFTKKINNMYLKVIQ
jgi:hypothetical protein